MANIDLDDYLDYGVRKRPRSRSRTEADIEGIRKAGKQVGISVEVSEELSLGAEGLLSGVVDDFADLSSATSRELSKLMADDGLSGRIVTAVESKEKLWRPKIRVLGWPEFESFLNRHDVEPLEPFYPFSIPMSDESYFVIFDLPLPLAHWWWKGKGNWGELGVDIGGTAIEWGRYYRKICYTVWDFAEEEGPWKGIDRNYFCDRYNAVGSHEPGEYYYIYKVGRPAWWWYKDNPGLEYNETQIQAAFRKALEEK